MTFDVYFDVLSRTADPDEWEAALAGIVEQAQRAEPAEPVDDTQAAGDEVRHRLGL